VYGQGGSFTTGTSGTSSTTLNNPTGLALDSSGNLYVADTGNNRVLYYASGSVTASTVYGQGGSFTTGIANNGGITATSLNAPASVTLDGGGNLYVADTGNNRVLYYASGSTTATRVYGQGGVFTADTVNNGGISSTSFFSPQSVCVDSSGQIYTADASNNRVLQFQTSLSVTTQPPASTPAGSTFSTAASLIDVGSEAIFTDFTGTVSVQIKAGTGPTGSTLSGTTAVSAVSGVATFSNLSINLGGTTYVLTFSSPGVGSADTNTFTIVGTLGFTPGTSPSFTLTINGSSSITKTAQWTIRIQDTTASGWHLALTSTQFSKTGGYTLSTTATTITSVSAACTSGQTCVLPTNSITGYPLTVPAAVTAPSPVTFYNAAQGTGTGDVTVTATFLLTVPGGSASGTYTSTFSLTTFSGP
jgi:hypothetical protein